MIACLAILNVMKERDWNRMMSMLHMARDSGMTVIVNENLHSDTRPEGMMYKLAAYVNDHLARLLDMHAFFMLLTILYP